jgi:carbonic anhydrase
MHLIMFIVRTVIVRQEEAMRRLTVLLITLILCPPLAAQTSNADALWQSLLEGNERFVAGTLTFDALKAERKEVAEHQDPSITVVSCSDSRVPPELVFDRSIGDLFVVRVAGNVVDDFGLASVEYAVLNGYTDLIVVLGHENCGAVKAALEQDDPDTPSLRVLVQRIRASFSGIRWDPKDAEIVRKAAEANARASAAYLPARSGAIRAAIHAGKVKVIPAYYSLTTGEVRKVE